MPKIGQMVKQGMIDELAHHLEGPGSGVLMERVELSFGILIYGRDSGVQGSASLRRHRADLLTQ